MTIQLVRHHEVVAGAQPSTYGPRCLAGTFTPQGEIWFDGERLDTLSESAYAAAEARLAALS